MNNFKLIIRSIFICAVFLLPTTACKHSGDDSETAVHIDKNKSISINRYLVNKDLDIMRHFVKRKSWKMHLSPDGYFYEIFTEGGQPKIMDNNSVTCDYTVTLLNGTLCYEIKNKVFVVGSSDEISGLHHAVKLLGKGGKARFIFPSHLAHGIQGDFNQIPPRAVLIYNVLVKEVEN
jgi:FKBP-type peptidyl-prolyl cis-trans isomerase